MDIEKKHAVVAGQLIRYYMAPGTKTPIVFLHGWRSEGNVWEQAITALSSQGTPCYALDLPGFGQSELPKAPFSVTNYAQVVTEFIKKMELKKVVVMGHSFGGRIAIKLASQNASLIEKLVLVDSGGIRNPSWGRSAKTVAAKIAKPIFKLPGTKILREKIYVTIGADDYTATPELTPTYLKVIEEDLQTDLAKITTPTLIIWGADDTATPLSDGKRMHELVKGSVLEILPSAGHFSFLDKPVEFLEVLNKFLITNI